MPVFLFTPGTLNLDIKPVGEIFHPAFGVLPGLVRMLIDQRLANVAFTTARQCDQTSGMTRYPVAAQKRYALVLAFLVALAQQVTQIQITFTVLAQQDQAAGMIRVIRVADQHIHPRNRLDSCRDCKLVKLDQSEHVELVGDSNRRHPQLFGSFNQLFESERAVYQ